MTATAVETLTAREAAHRYGLQKKRVLELARQGRLEAVMVDGIWLLDGASVAAYAAAHSARRPRLEQSAPPPMSLTCTYVPAAPLLRQIELRGGPANAGVVGGSSEDRALWRANRSGRLTEEMADHLAVRLLGLTPWELWEPSC